MAEGGKSAPGQLHHLEKRDAVRLGHKPVHLAHLLGGDGGDRLNTMSHRT